MSDTSPEGFWRWICAFFGGQHPGQYQPTSNYSAYQQANFIHPEHYPLEQSLDPQLYQPIGAWMGRLILPQPLQRAWVQGIWFEVYHAPSPHQHLVGQTVPLSWSEAPQVQHWVQAVRRDVQFSAAATQGQQLGGLVLPQRLNGWSQVDPLESLAGAHPVDDITVMLEAVQVEPSPAGLPRLRISRHPVEITGRYYALVRFIEPVGHQCYRVRHFNRISRQFDGPEEVMATPAVLRSPNYGSYPSTTDHLEDAPGNAAGWYVYGAQNRAGQFVVQAWLLRSHLWLRPDRIIFGPDSIYHYIRRQAWAHIAAQKGHVSSVLGSPEANGRPEAIQAALANWQPGDQALVLHVYGGIGGAQAEPAAATPLFFGHFAYGTAHVVHDPLADEQRFDIRYHQVYTHNTDGLTAGTLHICRYLGDRQLGWLGTRPTCDILIKLPCFTGEYDFEGDRRSPLWRMERFLQTMTARYRIGDGNGATFIGLANNCSQDSNQALFAAIQQMGTAITSGEGDLDTWAQRHPEQGQRFQQLLQFDRDLKRKLQPIGHTRPDWETPQFNLGQPPKTAPIRNILMGLGSWRSLFPRKASDTVVQEFLSHGAAVWVLRTNQVGGADPTIEPKAPLTF